MDVVGLLKSSYSDYATIITDWTFALFSEKIKDNILLAVPFIVLIIGLCYAYYWRKYQQRVTGQRLSALRISESFLQDMNRPRFRKRDKMIFYGRRMIRKVKTLSSQAYGGQGRKRRAVMKFARTILQLQKDQIPMQLKSDEPPAEYLEETTDGNDKVPPDALYMLQSIRVFGHFEKPVFLKLCKHTEILNLAPGELLFKPKDNDDSVFIVQSGLVSVLINNADGTTMSLKIVRKGESVTSLLSFIDVLVGNESVYKTVIARAVEKTQIIRLPTWAFKEVFDESPDILVRVIQVIMVRLQRVTFTALRNYLGLNVELVQNVASAKKPATAPVQTTTNVKSSPVHRKLSMQDYAMHTLCNTIEQRNDMLVDEAESHSARRISINAQQFENIEDSTVLQKIAEEGFMRELGLKEVDAKLLHGKIEIKEVQPGSTLIHEGNNDEICLIYLMSGNLSVLQNSCSMPGTQQKERTEIHTHTVHPGEIIGGLAVLTGEASLHTLRAKTFSRVAILDKQIVYNIMREKPAVVLDIAHSVIKRLSPLVRQCDYALDWVFLESGRAVYRQDEVSDCTYIVLSGRLRSVITHENGKKEIVGEYGKGDLIGIVEMITETVRTTTVMAVRDSELAKLPEGLFNAIKLRYPVVVTQLISLLSHRILGSMQANYTTRGAAQLDANPINNKFSTVAVVPISDDVPLTAFNYELYHSLCSMGPTKRLTSEVVRKTLGSSIMEHNHEYRLTSWLAQQEDRHKVTLYQCDSTLTAWTMRCMRQADVILIVGLGDSAPASVGKLEREIDKFAMRTQKELILLHHEGNTTRPVNTVQWLNMRSWVKKHHHIQCPKRMFSRKSQYRINELYSKVLMSEPSMHSDFSRVARWLTGNSVGLVLGGGGARGAAHIGMIKAIQDAGIPIDMVGGVSIGAFMGALWCSEKNITSMTQKAREWSKKMTQWGRQLLDLTYPITSMFSGRDFNQTIRGTFGDIYIEDLWIPYFTLTTDITSSCARIHTHGSLWRYVRSSMSLSGYMPPLCDPKDGHLLLDGGYVNNLPGYVWRYVRASMSIMGVFPPICDVDGHLLLDGCYINNVPADVMRSHGAAHIIAIDVGSQDDTNLTDYGDDLSGWWLLYKRWNPFTSPVKVPNLPDIQTRLAYVSCVRQLELVKNSDYCEYIRPPIDKYKTLAFGSFDEIKDVGYNHGKTYFESMAKNGRLSRFNKWSSQDVSFKVTHALNEYTFTDLAQIVCKVPETYPEKLYSDSEDEDFDGYISEPYTYSSHTRVKRKGGSLSEPENEIDSDDMEIPVPLKLKKDEAFNHRKLSFSGI